jgi:hypothetical protein
VDTHDGFAIADADLHLRGSGELGGLRQSGAADEFTLADLSRDHSMLVSARAVATELRKQRIAQRLALLPPYLADLCASIVARATRQRAPLEAHDEAVVAMPPSASPAEVSGEATKMARKASKRREAGEADEAVVEMQPAVTSGNATKQKRAEPLQEPSEEATTIAEKAMKRRAAGGERERERERKGQRPGEADAEATGMIGFDGHVQNATRQRAEMSEKATDRSVKAMKRRATEADADADFERGDGKLPGETSGKATKLPVKATRSRVADAKARAAIQSQVAALEEEVRILRKMLADAKPGAQTQPQQPPIATWGSSSADAEVAAGTTGDAHPTEDVYTDYVPVTWKRA